MELVLDEKKIRKGKPIGLPYVGSKKKISKKIVEIIKQNFSTDKPVYDVFGGGGAITAELILNGLNVHYNDLDKSITDVFQRVINQDREWIKTLIISREEFMRIRDKQDKTVDDELKLLVNSFGNDRKSYLYSKEMSKIKFDLAIDIIKNHNVFSGYKQTDTYKGSLVELEQLERLQQLQQLQQLGQLEELQQVNDVVTTNLDYRDLSDITESILYLDPPYENAANKYKNTFDSPAFYDWAFSMSKNNIVLISSYEISDDRFEPVFEFKTARSTFQGGTGKRYEKLFMVKK